MDRLKYALLAVFAGLLYGFIEVGIDWLGEAGLAYVPQQILKIAAWAILGTLILFILTLVVGSLLDKPSRSEAQLRIDGMKALGELIEGVQLEGPIVSSKDGSFFNAIVRMDIEKWSPAKTVFFHPDFQVASPSLMETDWYIFLYFRYKDGVLTPTPIQIESPCILQIQFEANGWQRKVLTTLSYTHEILSESGLGWFMTIATGLIVFVTSYIRKGLEKHWRTYATQKLLPFLTENPVVYDKVMSANASNLRLKPPPKFLKMATISATFKTEGREPYPQLQIDVSDRGFKEAIKKAFEWSGRFQVYAIQYSSALHYPGADD